MFQGLLLLLLTAVTLPAMAATSYNDQLDFFNHLNPGHHVVTEDLETFAANTELQDNTLAGGINIGINNNEPLVISDSYETTSGTLYLGLDNPDGALKANDTVTFSFAEPVTGFGFYLTTEESLDAGDFRLATAAGAAGNGDAADILLTDGRGYFIGILLDTSETGITAAELTASDSHFDFNYNIDDMIIVQDETTSSSSSSSSGSSTSSNSSSGSSTSGSSSSSSSSSGGSSNGHKGGGAFGWTGLLLLFGLLPVRRFLSGVSS